VTEAATNVPWLALCEDVVRALTFHARDLLPLRDVTLQIIALVDGKRDPGLAVVNQCLRNGLLKSVLMAPDGTMKPLASSDWGPPPKRTVGAPHNPAEGVYVEPYEAGLYFVQRFDPAKLTTTPVAQAEPVPAQPVELPLNASDVDKIVWAYFRLRVEAPDQLRLRGDALRTAVYKRITSGFTASRSSWTRAMAKVRELDRRAEPGE
jgi:hypothetical protein